MIVRIIFIPYHFTGERIELHGGPAMHRTCTGPHEPTRTGWNSLHFSPRRSKNSFIAAVLRTPRMTDGG